MRRPFAPSTSLTAVSAATTPSSPGLNSATSRLSVGGAGFASVYSGLAMERLWVRIVLLAAALSIALLLGGLEVSQRTIVCPPASNEAGGGASLILGSFQYQCRDGQLVSHS